MQTMTKRIEYEYSVIIEVDEDEDIQHQHLSEELEAYFNTHYKNVTVGEYTFKLHSVPTIDTGIIEGDPLDPKQHPTIGLQ